MSSVTRTIRKPYDQGISWPDSAQNRKLKLPSDQESETFYQSPEEDHENQGASPNEDGEFEVESILEKKIKRGQAFYKVKWKGYDLRHVTWEPEENLKNAPEKIEIFEKGLLGMPSQEASESPSEETKERKMTLLRKREWQDLRSKRKSQTPNNPDDEPEDEELEAGSQQGRKIVKTNSSAPTAQGQGFVAPRVEDGRYLNNPQNSALDYLKMSNMLNLNKDGETEAKSLEKSKDFKIVLQSELDKYRKENQESMKAFSSLLPNQNNRQQTFAMSIEEQLKALNTAPLRDRNNITTPSERPNLNFQDNVSLPTSFGQNHMAVNPALNQFNPQYPFPSTPDLYPQYMPMCNPLVDPLFTGSMNYLNNPLLTANDLALRNLITFQGSFQISNYLLPPQTNPGAFNPNRLGGFHPPNGFDPTQNLLPTNPMNLPNGLALPGDSSMNNVQNQNQQKNIGLPMVDPLSSQLMFDPLYLSAFKTPPMLADMFPKGDALTGNNMLKGIPTPMDSLVQMHMKPMTNDKIQQNMNGEIFSGNNLKQQSFGQQKSGKSFTTVNNNSTGINELNKSKGFTMPNK